MKYKLKMATSEAGKSTRRKKERVWTETELKYLALVLADEKTQYAVILATLAWATSVSKANQSLVKHLFAISSFSLLKEYSPSSTAFRFPENSFANRVVAAILKFAANLVKIGKVTIWLVPMPFRHA